jgi:hypothetical protein
MLRFGRFTFGEEQPIEVYEGDSMRLERGFVKILNGGQDSDLLGEQLAAVIHLDKGQSVRQLPVDCQTARTCP